MPKLSINAQTARIRDLNDKLRTTLSVGTVTFTRAVAELGPQAQRDILDKLRKLDDFRPENDPYGEHDFGSFSVRGRSIFFKIDYYDPDFTYHSVDPADPELTRRVLTVMLAEDY